MDVRIRTMSRDFGGGLLHSSGIVARFLSEIPLSTPSPTVHTHTLLLYNPISTRHPTRPPPPQRQPNHTNRNQLQLKCSRSRQVSQKQIHCEVSPNYRQAKHNRLPVPISSSNPFQRSRDNGLGHKCKALSSECNERQQWVCSRRLGIRGCCVT